MKYSFIIPLMLVAALLHAETTAVSVSAGPAEAAKAFYTKLRELNVRGLPQGKDWSALKPYLTDELATAIVGAQAEQAEFIKKNPDEKPPWVEGDLFSSTFEGVQQFTLGAAKVTGEKAEVPVACLYSENGSTTKWTDTLLMVKTAKGWQLDDVRFGGEWDFANKGTLKQSFSP